ncbi:MAG: flagellar export protein FliJ [Nitrospirota bacterium]
MPPTKLHSVSRLRQRRVDELRKEYAELLDQLHEEEARGDAMQALLDQTLQAVARQMHDAITPRELEAYYRFVAYQSTELQGHRSALDQLRAVCEEKRTILVQAKQDERVIVELERAHHARERRASDKREQHAADEFLTRRAVMKAPSDD